MLKNGKSAVVEISDRPTPGRAENRGPALVQAASTKVASGSRDSHDDQLNDPLVELRECKAEIRRMASRLVMIREEERKRIAGEIHDELGQAITVGKVQLSFLKKAAARNHPEIMEELDSVSELFSSMTESIRRISKNLYPLLLEETGLETAMTSFAGDYEKRTGIRCTVHLDETRKSASVEASFAIFRIFQEALTNVVRHAGASQVQISLSVCSRGLVLEIVDDGKGLQLGEGSGEGRGLLGIRERVMACGGQMSLSSLAGAGTSLLVLIPLNSNSA
jgi:signal transduction histidine kinase